MQHLLKFPLLLLSLFVSNTLLAQPTSLERLMQGNQRFVDNVFLNPKRSPEKRKALAIKQEPFATIVSCSDSRVPPEIVFDQELGDLFVVRVAGNVIGPLGLNSIDYSALILHSSLILVLGHENCGAVKAVIDGTTQGIEAVAKLIEPSVMEERKKNPPDLLEASIKANVLRMREYLLSTPGIQKLVADKKIEVHAGYYNFSKGSVEILTKNP